MPKPDSVPMLWVAGILACCFCCSPKSDKKSDVELFSVLDSLAQSDPMPILKMPDTLIVSSKHPLLITNRANRDSVQIFPYSLLFQEKLYNAFIVSFNDHDPTLITLDKNESVIDSVGLIGTVQKESPRYRIVKNVMITSPADIVVTDSIFRWDINENNERAGRSRTVEVWVKKYRIAETGTILGK